MLRQWLAAACIALLLPALAIAQEPTDDGSNAGADPNEGAAVAEETAADATDVVLQPAEFNTLHAQQIQWLLQRVTLLSEIQEAKDNRIAQLEAQLEQMKELKSKVEDLEAQLILMEQDSDLALGRMAEDPVLRSDLGRVMQGRLNLENFVGAPKVLYVNGTAWTVRTGESYIYVPVGKISIQESREATPTFIDMDQWTTVDGQLEATYKLMP